MGFEVTPDELRRAGNGIVDGADALNVVVDGHSGAQDAGGQANRGFATAKGIAECETSWEQVLSVAGTKMAVAGDKLVMNARQYAGVEQGNKTRLKGD
ncbi:nucleoside 2-deoxyribosyltransferase [Kibdelosporangium banguiense]|uniref:Nucleoside 2-deoxyribosyltransferase n=1 Tax=Kibdelosporangium banguiense TaxID=1365924 RepID=A0ABS4U283_9PSEU|nr:hypothetical protein [Kibdelosporangium banguiense]MBP2330768.1 nucleoside 2-deoxyribosyltransferase [Kibdelosporangium banguiense]